METKHHTGYSTRCCDSRKQAFCRETRLGLNFQPGEASLMVWDDEIIRWSCYIPVLRRGRAVRSCCIDCGGCLAPETRVGSVFISHIDVIGTVPGSPGEAFDELMILEMAVKRGLPHSPGEVVDDITTSYTDVTGALPGSSGDEVSDLNTLGTSLKAALDTCQNLLNEILEYPLTNVPEDTGETVFDKDKIQELRQMAEDHQANRKRKNIGVISSSLISVTGGGLTITGIALAPFTFGFSLGFTIAGVATGAAGAAVNMGFTLEKVFKDKKRMKRYRPMLEAYVNFHKNLFSAMSVLYVVQNYLASLSGLVILEKVDLGILEKVEISESAKTLVDEARITLDELHKCLNEPKTVISHMESFKHFTDRLSELTRCLGILICGQSKAVEEFLTELTDAKERPFEKYKERIPESSGDINRINVYNFFLKISGGLVAYKTLMKCAYSIAGNTGKVISNAVKTGKTIYRANEARVIRLAIQSADAIDDASKIGRSALPAIKGVSVAGIILSGVGIAVDLAFLGHAIHDLRRMNKSVKDTTNDHQFCQDLLTLVQNMVDCNSICEGSYEIEDQQDCGLP